MKNSDDVKVFFDDYVHKFDDIYNHVSQETKLNNFITKLFRKSMRSRMLNSFEDLDKKNINSILDVGCGSGRYSNILAKKKDYVLGIDFSEKMIGYAKENANLEKLKNLEFKVVSYQDFEYQRKFDAVICMGFFDYINDAKDVIIKILKNDPKIFLGSFPKKKNFLNFVRRFRYYVNNCPLYYYDLNFLKSFEKDFPNYVFDFIDLGREYYLRVTKK